MQIDQLSFVARLRTVGRRHGDDSGMTLIELIVAMGIFSIFLAMFGAGVVIMTKDTARTTATVDSVNQGRKAFSQLDKQLRSAAAINPPMLVGNRWYVEFQTTSTGATTSGVRNPALCTQWRLDTATDLVQMRTWNVGDATASAWRTEATSAVNTTSQQPFVFTPTSSTVNRQQLAVDFFIKKGSAPISEIESVLVARNSNGSTVTNANTSASRVCTEMDSSR